MRTSSETRCTSAPAPRQVSAVTTPAGRTTSCGPIVQTISSNPAEAEAALPWISFQGRWGELQKAFYNGPTGPNLKGQWTEPITWSEDWRDRSYAVPTGGVFGTSATDLFCSGVATGSEALTRLLRNPLPMLILIGLLLGLLTFIIVRVTWHPVAPLRLARRRTWGQIVSASARMYIKRLRLFLGIGLLLIPVCVRDHVPAVAAVEGDRPHRVGHRRGGRRVRVRRRRDRGDPDAARAWAGAGGHRLRAGRDRCRETGGRDRRLSACSEAPEALARRDRRLRARLGRPHLDGIPDPRRDLARGPMGAPRPCRRARGALAGLVPFAAAPSSSALAGSVSARSSGSAPPWRSPQARSSASP